MRDYYVENEALWDQWRRGELTDEQREDAHFALSYEFERMKTERLNAARRAGAPSLAEQRMQINLREIDAPAGGAEGPALQPGDADAGKDET